MHLSLSEQILSDISRFITARTGLSFPRPKWKTLAKSIAAAARETGFDEPARYARKILESAAPAELLEPLVGHLTIGETYFLRDKHMFQALQDHVIRGLIDHPRRPEKTLRFWSAGCATGEEAYSIAILLDRLGSRLNNWDIHILGTDVNQKFLKIAEQGIYTQWSMRETPESIIRTYFKPCPDNRFEILPRIRRQVCFTRLNFAEPDYRKILGGPKPMDVIFCRNVLMYHDPMSREHVINRLIDLLEENGWLITGPAESGFVNSSALTPVRFTHATFFRKGPARKEEKYPLTYAKRRNQERSPANPSAAGQRSNSAACNRRMTDTRPVKAPSVRYSYEDALSDYDQGRYQASADKLHRMLSNGRARNGTFLMQTEAMVLLTRCHANLGELKNAEYWCQAAIETEKLNPDLYFLLAGLHQAENAPEAAIRALKQSLYLDPDFVMAHFQLGLLLKQRGRPEESRKRFLNAQSLLKAKDPGEILPHSEGMTAGRMLETVKSFIR
ncbi:MAG: CheR family methyltransferase [Desulfobacterales bacterium]|nr:CheR family methyltransferase [Desulfobacterales bacterium]